jgi:DNA mismatch repair protein MutS
VNRAKELLKQLESGKKDISPKGRERQLELFKSRPHPVLEELRQLDLNKLTPLDALNFLAELKEKLKSENYPSN